MKRDIDIRLVDTVAEVVDAVLTGHS
jgi:hypothetical protein